MSTESGREYKHSYECAVLREKISSRQRRDLQNHRDRADVRKHSPSAHYVSARCFLRYAQEARLIGDEKLERDMVKFAENLRDAARVLRSQGKHV